MKTTVVFHKADYDGIFCREIARKFLPEAELIGWDFADPPLPLPPEGMIYILDLPVDKVFGFNFEKWPKEEFADFAEEFSRIVWIDHHKSSIESHPDNIPGYRIDGVSACRLAWQWFAHNIDPNRQSKDDFGVLKLDGTRTPYRVSEPVAVRLAGEYDVWDKRDPDAEVFQFALRSQPITPTMWDNLLSGGGSLFVGPLLEAGKVLQAYQQRQDANLVNHRSFMVEFEGLKFLTINHGQFNSLTFAAKDVPETGHDALMGFRFDGKTWTVSLYHAKHRTDLDLSVIAKKHGGGGHRGAAGMVMKNLTFLTTS